MKNKNLLITGGATRIGKEIALHFSKKGWNIAIHYFKSSFKAKNLKKIIEENSVKAALIKADLKNIKQVEKIIPLAKKKLGTINCLINNAALFEKDDILNFTTKSWNDHLNINLLAPTILTKQFAKQASKKTISNIINIIDQRVFKLTPIFMSYTLSKSALHTLTKTMAMRLSPNIKVNGILSEKMDSLHWLPEALTVIIDKSLRDLISEPVTIKNQQWNQRLVNHFRNTFARIQSLANLEQMQNDRVNYIINTLKPFQVDASFSETLAEAMTIHEEYLQTSLDLDDDSFEIKVLMPGQVVSTNSSSLNQDTLVWSFGLDSLLNNEFILQAESVIYDTENTEKIIILGVFILLILFSLLLIRQFK